MNEDEIRIVEAILSRRFKIAQTDIMTHHDPEWVDGKPCEVADLICRVIANSKPHPIEPMVTALLDYIQTGNFASLAVVLDQERQRIEETIRNIGNPKQSCRVVPVPHGY